MGNNEYKAILSALEKAIAICDSSAGLMDAAHEKICQELRELRAQVRRHLGLALPESPS